MLVLPSLRRSLAFGAAALLALAPVAVRSQIASPAPAASGAPIAPPAIDPAIAAMLAQVSVDRIRATDLKLVSFGTRNSYTIDLPSKTRGYGAASAWVESQFREIAKSAGGRMTVGRDEYVQQPGVARIVRPLRISSVIATLKGDDPSRRTYVMSSHLDSINDVNDRGPDDAPGADDNASAVSAVLEAARILAKTPTHATVIFAAYDSEEQGLYGSAHHAKVLHDAGVPVEADLNNDIVGASVGEHGEQAPYAVRVFSESLPPNANPKRVNVFGLENDSPSRELARFVKATGEAYVAPMHVELMFRADRFARGGDHESFNEQGFAAVRLCEMNEDFKHQHQHVRVENGKQYGDLAQYVDFDYLARVTRVNLASLATLALGPGRPKNVTMPYGTLSNDTTLKWDALPGATRYQVVYRSTDAPTWTNVIDAGNGTSITMPALSKDNVVFGVRALDAQGHASVAVYPEPTR